MIYIIYHIYVTFTDIRSATYSFSLSWNSFLILFHVLTLFKKQREIGLIKLAKPYSNLQIFFKLRIAFLYNCSKSLKWLIFVKLLKNLSFVYNYWSIKDRVIFLQMSGFYRTKLSESIMQYSVATNSARRLFLFKRLNFEKIWQYQKRFFMNYSVAKNKDL